MQIFVCVCVFWCACVCVYVFGGEGGGGGGLWWSMGAYFLTHSRNYSHNNMENLYHLCVLNKGGFISVSTVPYCG